MFESIIQKLQSLSPLTSPATSPTSSPKAKRKFGFGRKRKFHSKDDLREVQSEPELDYDVVPRRKDRRKISAPVRSNYEAIYDVPGASRTVGRMEGITKVERLSEYDRYFASLLVDTHPDHVDYSNVYGHHSRLGELRPKQEDKEEGEDGELERIQELFPNDNLRLHDRDPIAQKMKGLMRKRSTTAARLQRAFSAKGSREDEDSGPCNSAIQSKPDRQFIMETPVQFTTGVQSQERHLFLFTDLLLVAKARSGGNFKLKEKVRVSEMWLSSFGLDDVSEVPKSQDSSFVMGWPTTNVVVSFSCVATKDLWFNRLAQAVSEQRQKEPPEVTVQVTYYDPVSATEICKRLNISSTDTAKDCIAHILSHIEIGESDPSKFRLWARTSPDEAPYPLIGHEYPYAIQMNSIRENVQDCSDVDQLSYSVNANCQFILREARKFSLSSPTEALKGRTKKTRKSPIRIHRVFRRSNSKGDSLDGLMSPVTNEPHLLFGVPLVKLFEAEGGFPKIVKEFLVHLFMKGPFTVGIFRKSANAKQVKELRKKLDSFESESVALDAVHVTVIASLFTQFLRSLPDCLLLSHLYEEWLHIPYVSDLEDKISRTRALCLRLPQAHYIIIQHFICVLYYISQRASKNKMSASNLAVCVGPSILWNSQNPTLNPEASKQEPAVIEFLIKKCNVVFGDDTLHLFGDPPERDPSRQDSGAEESDSLHSSVGFRRDDSSIDSLERASLGDGELSPLPRKDKMSLTNLSQDSGLTTSDSQLYTPDEEESESTSSGHSSGEKNAVYTNYMHNFHHYSAPNDPNAIYAAVYRHPGSAMVLYDDVDGQCHASPKDQQIQMARSIPGSAIPKDEQEYTQVYQNRYDLGGRWNEEKEAIYSTPAGSLSVPVHVLDSNFQRHDWMRRQSHPRKASRTGSGEGMLMRSNSEENLLTQYNTPEVPQFEEKSRNGIIKKSIHSKGRAPSPPSMVCEDTVDMDLLMRSNSVHYLMEQRCEGKPRRSHDASTKCESQDVNSWHRSHSTPHIREEVDCSYDSSTLSDDDNDSTPHVSRSNSRGKDCTGHEQQPWDDAYGVVQSDSGDSHNSRNSSFKSERTGSICTVVSAGSATTLASNPPSYEEALSRRALMQGKQGNSAMFDSSFNEDKKKSARAKQLYEESLRIYNEENTYNIDLVHASPIRTHDDFECPPPLPPKAEPPPLPPKQKTNKHPVEGLNRWKHLPPVHIDSDTRRQRTKQANTAAYDTTYHKTIIEVEPSYSYNLKDPVSPLVSKAKVEKRNIETQTDDCDLSDSFLLSPQWLEDQHITSVTVVPDSPYNVHLKWRSRSRCKDSSSHRSRSVPGRDNLCSDAEEDAADCYIPSSGYKNKLERSKENEYHDEIHWSVAELSERFGGAMKEQFKVRKSNRAPITTYHLGAGDTFTRKRSNYGEESYV